jgi:hypothetical protein
VGFTRDRRLGFKPLRVVSNRRITRHLPALRQQIFKKIVQLFLAEKERALIFALPKQTGTDR